MAPGLLANQAYTWYHVFRRHYEERRKVLVIEDCLCSPCVRRVNFLGLASYIWIPLGLLQKAAVADAGGLERLLRLMSTEELSRREAAVDALATLTSGTSHWAPCIILHHFRSVSSMMECSCWEQTTLLEMSRPRGAKHTSHARHCNLGMFQDVEY